MDAQKVLDSAKKGDTDLLRVLATELKSPLLHMAGIAQLLRTEKLSEETLDEQYIRLELSSNHMLQLVDSLLLAGRVDSLQTQLELEPINLSSITQSTLQTLQPLAIRYGRSIHITHKGRSLAPVSANREAVEHSLYCVLDTIIRSSQSEVVEIVMQQKANQVDLSIRDDGYKISKRALEAGLASLGKRTQFMKQMPATAGLSLYVANVLTRAQLAQFRVQNHKNKRVVSFSFIRSQQLQLPL